MNKAAVTHIIDKLGAETICATLGVSRHAVRHARFLGAFAAGWFDALDHLCAQNHVPCPRDAFNWRHIAKKYSLQPTFQEVEEQSAAVSDQQEAVSCSPHP